MLETTLAEYWEPEALDKACTIGELKKALERYEDDALVFYCDEHWFKAVPVTKVTPLDLDWRNAIMLR